LAQIMPFVEDHRIKLDNVAALITILENAFGDPDRAATAERELNKLGRTNRDFSLYYAEFQHLFMELDYNDAAKRNTLRRGLLEQLKDALSYNPNQPEDLQQFVNLCNRPDKQIRACKAEKRGDAPVTAPRGTPAPTNTNRELRSRATRPKNARSAWRRADASTFTGLDTWRGNARIWAGALEVTVPRSALTKP